MSMQPRYCISPALMFCFGNNSLLVGEVPKTTSTSITVDVRLGIDEKYCRLVLFLPRINSDNRRTAAFIGVI